MWGLIQTMIFTQGGTGVIGGYGDDSGSQILNVEAQGRFGVTCQRAVAVILARDDDGLGQGNVEGVMRSGESRIF